MCASRCFYAFPCMQRRGLYSTARTALMHLSEFFSSQRFSARLGLDLLDDLADERIQLHRAQIARAAAHSDGGEKIFLKDREELHTKNDDMMAFIGKRGQTRSVLRPAGIGDFDGVRLNVVTEGDYIESGRAVEIVSVEGARIVVKAVRE